MRHKIRIKNENIASLLQRCTVRNVLQVLVTIYVCLMMLAFPLHRYRYYCMGQMKYEFFIVCGMTFLPLIAIFMILALLKKGIKEYLRSQFSLTDWLVTGYAAVLIISYLLSGYKDTALWGVRDWHMGLIAQLMLVVIYFAVSRFFYYVDIMKYLLCLVAEIVFLVGVLNRFALDPLSMYLDYNAESAYLSTIGQPTWYSGYLCIILPVLVYLYWDAKTKRDRMIYTITLVTGMASLVTQNSDSAYVALILMFMCLMTFSFRSNEYCGRFLEITVISLATFKVIGILQIVFRNRVFVNDKLSLFMTQGSVMTIVLIVAVMLHIWFIKLTKNADFNVSDYKKIPVICWGILGMAIAGAVILIVLVSNGWIPESLYGLRDNNYLNFTNHWGDARGINWRYTMKLYVEAPISVKIFGCGPDCYYPYMYDNYGDVMNAFWGTAILCNAHNEWLNQLITVGIAGAGVYIGIFIAQFREAVKQFSRNKSNVLIALVIISYAGHQLFCYQQVVGTPTVFILLGFGAGLNRKNAS